ncbi:MAG: lysophospholipid acyltransferase family protein [Alistipes sp.]
MKTRELTLWQRLRLECLWYTCCLFAHLPYWFRYYVIESLITFVLTVIRYRRKVVLTNLRNSFPEKGTIELCQIAQRFYRTLSEVIVDTISMAGMSAEKSRQLVQWKNGEEQSRRTSGRDWIAMASHFGCWEYCLLWGTFDATQSLVGVYHELKDPVFEHFYRRLRKLPNTLNVTMQESMRFYLRNRGNRPTNLVMGLIADQNPPLRPNSHWFRFLNQDTIFFDGGEKMALRFGMPAYFVHMNRLKRGRYEIWFEELYDGQEAVEPDEIVGRYVRCLEQMIVEQPEMWMWSHRRWKHRKPATVEA